MSSENNKSIVKKAISIWSTGNVQAVDEVYSANCVHHQQQQSGSQSLKGPDSLKKFIQEFRSAFPDYKDTIEDQIAEGNKVVTRFTSQGTQKGSLMGIAPTNKKATWTGIVIDRIENGKIVESWVNWDKCGMLQQLGVHSAHSTK